MARLLLQQSSTGGLMVKYPTHVISMVEFKPALPPDRTTKQHTESKNNQRIRSEYLPPFL